jgi:site-specific recombinase XerD
MPVMFASVLEIFLNSKKVSIRPKTYEQYQYLVQQIRKGAVIAGLEQAALDAITLENLETLVAILDNPKYFPALGETTVKKMVKFLKATFTWCYRRKWISSDPAFDLRFRRVHAQETQPFQTDELLALLSVQPVTPAEFRDLAMWFVFADSGLRCQELCHLQISDLSDNELVIRSGKGGKRRSVSLGETATRFLHEYVDTYRPSGADYLFLTDEGSELKPRHVAKRLELWAKKAGVKKAAPHRFRATFATQFVLREGNDLVKLQVLLGHSTLDMSRRYVKLAIEEEARLSNSTRSVVDQLLLGNKQKPVEEPPVSMGLIPTHPADPMVPMGLVSNSQDTAVLLGMFQMFAGMMNAFIQSQQPAGQVTALPSGDSGNPKVFPFSNLPARK